MRSRLPVGVHPAWLDVVDRVARRALGREDRTGDALADAVRGLSETYTQDRGAIDTKAASTGAMAARLRFFFCRDLPKIGGPLAELKRLDALPLGALWKVLDVGAGLGATSLGAASWVAANVPGVALDVLAVDRETRALALLDALAKDAPVECVGSLSLRTKPVNLEKTGVSGLGDGYDLVLAGLVLNEAYATHADPIGARAQLLAELAGRLAPGGSLVVVEPALKETSRALQAVRDRIVASGLHVVAPCLHAAPCPMLAAGPRDWCHAELAYALPEPLRETARAAGLRFEGLGYAYLVVRREARNEPDALRVVSDPLVSKGKRELVACGARGLVRYMRLDRDATEANAAFEGARRGDVLSLDGAEGARVGREVFVRRASALER